MEMAKTTWNGVLLAESDPYEVVERNIYFPPQAIKWEYLKKRIDNTSENPVWSYTELKPAAKNIEGYVAFEPGKGIKAEK